MLGFEWDEHNTAHLARHGVSPEEAEQVTKNAPKDLLEENRSGEVRLTQLGETDAKRILLVVLTYRNSRIRVISAWPAKKRFRAYWFSIRRD